MDDIENLEAHISYLQEDIGQRFQLLNDDQSTEDFLKFNQSETRIACGSHVG